MLHGFCTLGEGLAVLHYEVVLITHRRVPHMSHWRTWRELPRRRTVSTGRKGKERKWLHPGPATRAEEDGNNIRPIMSSQLETAENIILQCHLIWIEMIAVRDFVITLILYAVAHLSHLNGCAQTSSAVWIQLTFRCSVQENWKEMMDLFRKDYSDICADNTKGWELLPVAMTTFETTRRKASIVGKIGQGTKQRPMHYVWSQQVRYVCYNILASLVCYHWRHVWQ